MKKAWLQCMMLAGMLLISACQKEETQKVTPALVQETQVSAQEFTQGKTGSGVWKVEKDGVSYLLFYGEKREYSGVQADYDEKTGTLTVNFHSADGAGEPLLYRLEGQPETLILLDNGQQVELQS
ncbi:hypothetical protein [Intestinimonas butyriciproducens]|uniref:hypothetical protein n=1 Tax=Intestinimonas butyriciproducens TaxID=1297617 RepID=UPI0019574231|nr:hypothetical protein [Intestinimonas butyriciproducens]MBM6918094.1 hypothetical protein [Intestinimonas butyriciproducens]